MTVGCFEFVHIPTLGIESIIAKIDTGAYSGALHCTNIREKDDVLSFVVLDKERHAESTTDYEVRYVRSATGHRVKRYIIKIDIIMCGQKFSTSIGLSNRSSMNFPMLIGRRFLRENGICVDVRKNSEYDKEMKEFE